MTLAERFGTPRRLVIDHEAAAGGEHARRTGRSWWALRFTDDHIVREWDPDRASPTGHRDWPNLAMRGLLKGACALRLYCPNGRMAELGGEGDQTGRLFQFKQAVRYVSVSADGAQQLSREVMAHVIGIITGYDGQCLLYAWEPLPEPPPPPGAPQKPLKPRAGPLDFHQPLWYVKEEDARYAQELAAWQGFMLGEPMREWKRQLQQWEASGRGRLVGPIEDNVYCLRYRQIGRLNADHLGIVDGEGR